MCMQCWCLVEFCAAANAKVGALALIGAIRAALDGAVLLVDKYRRLGRGHCVLDGDAVQAVLTSLSTASHLLICCTQLRSSCSRQHFLNTSPKSPMSANRAALNLSSSNTRGSTEQTRIHINELLRRNCNGLHALLPRKPSPCLRMEPHLSYDQSRSAPFVKEALVVNIPIAFWTAMESMP